MSRLFLFLVSCSLLWADEDYLDIIPFLERYCYDCHGDGLKEGGLNLDRFTEVNDLLLERDLWGEIQNHLALSLMPPLNEFQPTKSEREQFISWIEKTIYSQARPDPGPQVTRRLNRVEFENTLNDLLDLNGAYQELLPADDSGYGYDNIGAVLTVSPSHVDKYFQAVELALEEAFSGRIQESHFQALSFDNQAGGIGVNQNGYYIFPRNAVLYQAYDIQSAGQYELLVKAGGVTDEVPPLMELGLAGKASKRHFVTNGIDFDEVKTYRLRFEVSHPGIQTLQISLLNRPNSSLEQTPTGQLQIYDVHLARLDGSPFSFKAFQRFKGGKEELYFQQQLFPFLSRAYRRAVSEEELARYVELAMNLSSDGGFPSDALKATFSAALLSPSFLYRELPMRVANSSIDEFTLANRLSYFLWSSMPDEELLNLAENSKLREVLDAQVDRMLDSPKAEAFIENFFGQWLQLRDLELTKPSPRSFPYFDSELTNDMEKETQYLIRHILEKNLPCEELLSADYTFLNESLAKHYGINFEQGEGFQKVKSPVERFGILGHGSFLMLTSHPDRTSPVLRGKYILENLLDLTPPPPPQNANQLSEEGHARLPFRQQLELHRKDAACASCHNLMDPLGFGLERYDAVGRLRKQYSDGSKIDVSGTLFRGEGFSGSEELRKQLLSNYKEDFHRSVIKNLFIYALGRGTEWFDRASISQIYEESEGEGFRIRAVIKALVNSVSFQEKRMETEEK